MNFAYSGGLALAVIFVLSAGPTARPANAAAKNGQADAVATIERIMQADINGDQQVTRAELRGYRAEQFSRLDRNGDGFVSTDDVPSIFASRFAPRIKMLQEQFDVDHDGKVSRNELVNGPTLAFDGADGDHDGVVTRPEAQMAVAMLKGLHGQ